MALETVSLNRSHGGVQGVYKHASRETATGMTFSVFVPPHQDGARLPVVWYLSGLTCTHANVTEKGEFRRACAELGLVFVAPDTSPRGEGVPGDPAGRLRFRTWRRLLCRCHAGAICAQLPHVELCDGRAPRTDRRAFSRRCPTAIDPRSFDGWPWRPHNRAAHPGRYRAASAFSPIVAPSQVPWGIKALGRISRRGARRVAQARYRRTDRGWRAVFRFPGRLSAMPINS